MKSSKRPIFYLFSLSFLALLAYFLISNAPARSISSGNRPNVILISIDSLRADHLSSYGYARKTTPNIDRLAKEGVLFSNAFSTTSWTLPAHLTMLTSLYSQSHGVITGNYSLDPKRVTIAEVLKGHGYTTAGFVSAPYMDSVYGYDQGFDLYDDSINGSGKSEKRHGHRQITSPRINELTLRWLNENHQKKFFLLLHYFDVHYDYVPPAPFDTMFDSDYTGDIDGTNFAGNRQITAEMNSRDLAHIIALYDGEIAYTDKHTGEIFNALKKFGVYDNTLIVLTSDHGEEFFEHGRKGHRHSLYDEVLRVPLIIKLPAGKKPNTKIEEIASIVDIMPTILGSLGIDLPDESQGKNLLNPAKQEPYAYARLQDKLIAIRSSNFKLIRNLKQNESEFYNLQKDSGEKKNLLPGISITDQPDAKQHLTRLLDWLNWQFQVSQELPKSKKSNRLELDEGLTEQLKALGYVQ